MQQWVSWYVVTESWLIVSLEFRIGRELAKLVIDRLISSMVRILSADLRSILQSAFRVFEMLPMGSIGSQTPALRLRFGCDNPFSYVARRREGDQLCGTVSNRDAIGARLIASTSKRKLFRTIIGGGSYLTQAPYLVHFSLPSEETIERLEIRWPNDTVSTMDSPARNQYSLLVEPQTSPGTK